MIIDHVTGEITLEKLSSQIMVKKTRSEKPGSKLDDVVLPTPSSRPHTPNNFSKHDSYKSNLNKKVTSEHKPGTMSISLLITVSSNEILSQHNLVTTNKIPN